MLSCAQHQGPVPAGQKRAVSLASLGCVCRPGVARELEHREHLEEGTDKGRSFFTDIIPKDTRCPYLELEATLAKDVMDFHSLHPSGLSRPTYLPTHARTHARTLNIASADLWFSMVSPHTFPSSSLSHFHILEEPTDPIAVPSPTPRPTTHGFLGAPHITHPCLPI